MVARLGFGRFRTVGALALVCGAAGPALAQEMPVLGQLAGASQVVVPQVRSFDLVSPGRDIGRDVQIESVQGWVKILDQTASTTLQIALRNPSSRPQEAILLLPVPDGAVVSAFAFEGAASEPTAEVLPADEARRLYEAIVAKVRDPALLEFAGYNVIRSSVFPVPPQGTQKIRVTYEHLLDGDADRVDYVLPRSESLLVQRPWQVAVELRSEHPISMVYSPSHEVTTERLGPGHFSIRLDGAAATEPGPLRISYLRERGGVSASLMAYPDPGVGGGYFLLMAGLSARLDDATSAIRREVTLVIDRSGSMAGSKMDQVRAAALQVIEGLADGETFNIIDYASSVSSFAQRPVVKDRESAARARRYLAAIRPGGGTNIHDALLEALRQAPPESKLPIVLFLTDGLPTIGRTSELAIREMVAEGNPHRRRVFTFGVGADVNVPLLDRIATVSRGTSTYVLPGENVELKVAQVFKQLSGPVFAEPRLATIDSGGQPRAELVFEVIPDTLPDLFHGDQLILLGKYRGGEPITFSIAGDYLGVQRTFEFTFDFDSATTRNAFVPRLWASRRIAYLIEQIRQSGAAAAGRPFVAGASLLDDPRYRDLVDEIVRLSTEFGILTEYTAFLAREGTDLADFNELVLGCRRELETKAVRTRSGVAAVSQALNWNRQKGQTALNYRNRFVDGQLKRVEISAVQQMCDRAFFRRGNRWIDSRLIDKRIVPEQTLMIGTPEHADLVRLLVGQGRAGVLSLAGEILLEVDGRVILVTDGC